MTFGVKRGSMATETLYHTANDLNIFFKLPFYGRGEGMRSLDGSYMRKGSDEATHAGLGGLLTVAPILIEAQFIRSAKVGMSGAKFAQNGKHSETFSKIGQNIYSKIAKSKIESVDDLAKALIDGKVKPSDIKVNYIVKNGEEVILNTRTSAALNRANVPMEKWNGVNVTGKEVPGMSGPTFDDLGNRQIMKNYKPGEPLSSKPPE